MNLLTCIAEDDKLCSISILENAVTRSQQGRRMRGQINLHRLDIMYLNLYLSNSKTRLTTTPPPFMHGSSSFYFILMLGNGFKRLKYLIKIVDNIVWYERVLIKFLNHRIFFVSCFGGRLYRPPKHITSYTYNQF